MIEKMDLDIGSLIYILITVVAVIAGIAGKKKKSVTGAKAAEGAEGAEKKTTSGGFFGKLESQLESFTSEAKQSFMPQQEAVIQEDEVVVERDYFETLSDDYDKKQESELAGNMAAYEGLYSPDDIENDPLMEAEGISVTDAIELIHLDDNQTGSIEDQRIIEEFDVRTAIIYSAIINRIEI